MNNKNTEEMIKELTIEDFLSSIFIILGILSIYADQVQKEYIKTNEEKYQDQANTIFNIIVIATFILYIFFFYRNYKNYEKAPQNRKELFKVRLLGSCFFLAGILCTMYFQFNNRNYAGVPEL